MLILMTFLHHLLLQRFQLHRLKMQDFIINWVDSISIMLRTFLFLIMKKNIYGQNI